MTGRKEELFWDTLQNLFVGVPVEGESGYINLMRLKTRYFQCAMRPALQDYITEQLREFPDFREELFDKLYTFLKRYISEETGSIGFFFTPYHQSVYEQVYTDTQDVILFWKTQRLYYVKTDRLFRSLETELNGFKFYFDASTLEHKKANEKRELVFEFKEIRPSDGVFVFTMQYSEQGRKTKLDDIRRAIRNALGLSKYTDAVPSEETLEQAFRVFERQSEVDYFLCKDAQSFLREQFDLWMWQYLLGKPGEEPHTEWTEPRLKQLQVLKRVAYRVIDYIAAFEDELVKIWNKPKFVLNSHYVITLDRIVAQQGGWEVLEAIFEHPNLERQIQEWRELGMVSEDFTVDDLVLLPSEPLDLFSIAKERGLITTGYHLPYNPELVERARELRKNPTPAEQKLWNDLLRHYPYRVLRQRPIDHFIVDFYCPQLKLVIEVDGEQHYTDAGKQHDAERTRILEGYGLRVVRFPNDMVLHRFEEVKAQLIPPTPSPSAFGDAGFIPPTPTPSPLSKGGRGAGDGGINPRYQHLPIDTRYFKDLELRILALFDPLDDALDGWLIKSENYQALNTILPKWKGKVQCIYIDPPYNTTASEIDYVNRYKHSTWITLVENRLRLAEKFLQGSGLLCVTIDDVEVAHLKTLLSEVFMDEDAILGTVVIRSNPAGRSTQKGFAPAHEYAIFGGKKQNTDIGRLEHTERQIARYSERDEKGAFEWVNFRKHGGANAKREARPKLFYPIYVSTTGTIRIPDMRWDESCREWIPLTPLGEDEEAVYPITENNEERTWKWGHEKAREQIEELIAKRDKSGQFQIYLKSRLRLEGTLPATLWDKKEYSAPEHGTKLMGQLFGSTTLFSFPKSVYAVMDCLKVANLDDEEICLDFFAGSGTTAHAVMNLNRQDGGRRRYILVEMADYFYSVLLPRVKKVAFSAKWREGKARPDGKGVSHFVKYYELEQFEDTLRRVRYADSEPIPPDDAPRYLFLRDLKLTDALEIEGETVRVALEKLYPNIDLAETLSNLMGKPIRRIEPDPNDPARPAKVIFTDGSEADLQNPDWKRIKPLIWWKTDGDGK